MIWIQCSFESELSRSLSSSHQSQVFNLNPRYCHRPKHHSLRSLKNKVARSHHLIYVLNSWIHSWSFVLKDNPIIAQPVFEFEERCFCLMMPKPLVVEQGQRREGSGAKACFQVNTVITPLKLSSWWEILASTSVFLVFVSWNSWTFELSTFQLPLHTTLYTLNFFKSPSPLLFFLLLPPQATP